MKKHFGPLYYEGDEVYIKLGKHTFIDLFEEWTQFFHRCNWYEFHFCKLRFMWDKCVPGWEFDCFLLGLGFHFRQNFNWEGTEFGEALRSAEEYMLHTAWGEDEEDAQE